VFRCIDGAQSRREDLDAVAKDSDLVTGGGRRTEQRLQSQLPLAGLAGHAGAVPVPWSGETLDLS